MRTLLSAAVLVLCTGVLNAATIHVPADRPTIEWIGTYGGESYERAFRIIQTPDSGCMFLGTTHSYAEGEDDYYFVNVGPAPIRPGEADIDGSCSVDISDLVYVVDYMFAGGPAPLVGCE